MVWLHLVILIFSALTLQFTYGEYKQNSFSKKSFIWISVMEIAVIIVTAVMLIMSI